MEMKHGRGRIIWLSSRKVRERNAFKRREEKGLLPSQQPNELLGLVWQVHFCFLFLKTIFEKKKKKKKQFSVFFFR